MMPVKETHERFWKGRQFEVLLLPEKTYKGAKWVKGEVIKWTEWNMGPGDRFCKWTLYAKMLPDGEIGLGSLIHGNEESSDGKTKPMAVIDPDAVEDAVPFDGEVDFFVEQLNVQGGGILKDSGIINGHDRISMRWLDKVSEEEDVPLTGDPDSVYHKGCWYFDPAQQILDLPDLAKDPRVEERRNQLIGVMNGEGVDPTTTTFFNANVMKRLKSALLSTGEDDELLFEIELLATPFLFIQDVLTRFADFLKSDSDEEAGVLREDCDADEWYSIIYSITKIALFLRYDDVWYERSGTNRYISDTKADASLYQMIKSAGEWFEARKQYRAAIWAYEENLRLIQNRAMRMTAAERLDSKLGHLSYIGLAYKSMGDFVNAALYYDQNIALMLETSSPKDYLNHNCKTLQNGARKWYGTANSIVPFDCTRVNETLKCFSCGKEGPTKRCGACGVSVYCSAQCQRDHWRAGHKKTCLGKLRGKGPQISH